MAIELPKEKTKATRLNPKSMVIFSQPKMGKTTILGGLDNCLIIDLEKGTHFLEEGLVFDVKTKAEEQGKLPIVILKQLINAIAEANKAKGGYEYKYIALDTVTALEEVVLPLANKLYQDTPMGRNWTGNDVTTLANGAGYKYTREALSTVLNELKELCDTFIILGHVKEKDVEKSGELITARSLDLTGKSSSILCSQVDAIGYLYRDENKTVINFHPSEELVCGARSKHLKDKTITVAESNEAGDITVDWSKIFINK